MDETKKIQDAVVEKADDTKVETVAEEKAEEVVPEEKVYRNKKADFYIELGLILILGILIGIAVKTEAKKKITIGFSDYLIKQVPNSYNINQMEIQAQQQQAQGQTDASGSDLPASPDQSQNQQQSQNSGNNSNQ